MGAAFLLGLAGSLHCVLMCGPLMLILASSKKTAFLKHHLIYHSGRLLMYLLLGFAASMVGMGFTLAGAHQVLAIALGVLVVLVGLGQLLHQQRRFKIPGLDQFSELLLRKYNRLKSPNVFIKGAQWTFTLWFGLCCLSWRSADEICCRRCFLYARLWVGNHSTTVVYHFLWSFTAENKRLGVSKSTSLGYPYFWALDLDSRAGTRNTVLVSQTRNDECSNRNASALNIFKSN